MMDGDEIMADYKSMYYYMAGKMSAAIDALETTSVTLDVTTKALEASTRGLSEIKDSLIETKERLKFAQKATEEMFMDDDE